MLFQKIRPCLWFASEAEAAANHYIEAFPDGRIDSIERYGNEGPGPEGSVMVVAFTLAGQQLVALNGGSRFMASECMSLVVTCDDQAEVDRLWSHLSAGGTTSMCGWLKDRWGFSWQIVPRRFFEMMDGHNPLRKARVISAMLRQSKFDIAALEQAWAA